MILWTSESSYCMESSGHNVGLWMLFCHPWPELPWNANSFHVQKEKSWGPPNVSPPFTENETLEGAIKERCQGCLVSRGSCFRASQCCRSTMASTSASAATSSWSSAGRSWTWWSCGRTSRDKLTSNLASILPPTVVKDKDALVPASFACWSRSNSAASILVLRIWTWKWWSGVVASTSITSMSSSTSLDIQYWKQKSRNNMMTSLFKRWCARPIKIIWGVGGKTSQGKKLFFSSPAETKLVKNHSVPAFFEENKLCQNFTGALRIALHVLCSTLNSGGHFKPSKFNSTFFFCHFWRLF